MTTYTYRDIFEDIPGDPDNVLMKIPVELEKDLGWEIGDNINITLDNGSMVLCNVSKQTGEG